MARHERIVDVPGAAICVDVTGPADAPALLLAQGAACSLDAWPDALVERLAVHRRVVRFDWRDTGRSSLWPVGRPGYGLPDLVGDVVAVLDTERVAAAHLVGVSMGGAVAQLVALGHPGRVRSLTLISSTPGVPGAEADDLPGPDGRAGAGDAAEPDWSDRAAVVRHLVEEERPYQRGGFEPDVQREVAERTVERSTDLRTRTNHDAIAPGPGWRARLGDIAVPTLVVHGADDPSFPLPHARALAAEIPGAILHVVPGAGHGVPPRRAWPGLVERLLALTSGT